MAIVLAGPVFAQNTKGDRPVNNNRTVRETRSKSVTRKKNVTTRDIAGRRLRTKNRSSANRANVGIPQPSTSSRQPRHNSDRAARVPASRKFASREQRRSDPDRQWQGDISGYKPRKIKPPSAGESGKNVYPQRKYATREPRGKRPFQGYENKTASGRPVVKRTPQRYERAWKGDIQGQPLAPPPSQTGRLSNVYRQRTKYSKYVSKAPSGRDRPVSNRDALAKASRLRTDTSPKKWGRTVMTPTGQRPFVTPGRKNVYWGKMKRYERANTRDLAGRPLTRRNFASTGIGLVGRDTLAFFGRRPHGDTPGQARKRRFVPGSEARGGWLGDIAGFRLRKKKPGAAEQPGTHQYSGYRSISGTIKTNRPIGKGRFGGSKTGSLWNNNRTPIGGKSLPADAGRAGNFSGNIKGLGRALGDQGGGFSGVLKAQKKGKYKGFGKRGNWNNGGVAIEGKLLPGGATRAGLFSGRTPGKAEKDFADQGSGFTGFTKARKGGKFIGYARRGNWNNGGVAVRGKLLPGDATRAGLFSGHTPGKAEKDFADQGSGFTGFTKAQKKGKFIGYARRGNWNNGGSAIQGKLLPGDPMRAGLFSGHTPGKQQKDYADQGSGFTGVIKAQKKGKFIGYARKGVWNNGGTAVRGKLLPGDASRAGLFSGNIPGDGQKVYADQGEGFSGYLKAKKPHKFKGSMTGGLWNNKGKPVTELEATKAAAAAGTFQGRSKTRQEKGKMLLTPSKLWNNNEKAVTRLNVTKDAGLAGIYQGRNKAKKQSSYPINSDRKMWNNEGKATTQITLTKSGASAGLYQGTMKYHKPNKDVDADIEARLKMKRQYTQNPHAVEEATKKQKPDVNYKAGHFASGVKVNGKRMAHRYSNDEAIDGVFLSKASARAVDYKGNLKTRKFLERRDSPDAQFVHIGENNSKEDRTLMTGMKLFWAKLFQRSDSQPTNLKDKPGKLRYDKGEKGLWND